ncbi:MAG: sulfite exporter TauE/SafE family protein [Bacteroidia bacterium]
MLEQFTFADYSLLSLLLLALFAFIAGFIDAVVGGGGLIQLPALLIQFPQTNLPTLFGTNKIAALSGTIIAAIQYAKKVKFNLALLLIISLCAYLASGAGAKIVSLLDVKMLKPIILVILIVIAIYTIFKKDLGSIQLKQISLKKQMIYGSLIGVVVGFYDGFFGPGTGSFLVLGFVLFLGMDFMHASAYAKIVNCITNLSALVVFINQGNYLLNIAVLMGVSNILGSYLGSRMAIKKGNAFIRNIFIFIVMLMIIRYAYDVFFK